MDVKKKQSRGPGRVLKTISTDEATWAALKAASVSTGINVSRLATAALKSFCELSAADIAAKIARK